MLFDLEPILCSKLVVKIRREARVGGRAGARTRSHLTGLVFQMQRPEAASQRRPAAVEAGHDGAGGTAEYSGRLGIAHPLQVDEGKHRTKWLRQRSQRAEN